MSEWMGDFYKEKFGVPFVALRYSSVYGPGLGRGIPLELKKGVLGQPCRPYLTRLPDDLIYIDDVTDAVRRALFSEKPLSRAYNIARQNRRRPRSERLDPQSVTRDLFRDR
jgi:nucleoside-diphosphate-sugar epimerase